MVALVAVALVVAVGLTMVAVGLMVVAVGLTMVALGLMVAAVGLMVVAVGLTMPAVGLTMVAVGLTLVAVGLTMPAVGLMMIAVGWCWSLPPQDHSLDFVSWLVDPDCHCPVMHVSWYPAHSQRQPFIILQPKCLLNHTTLTTRY